ncbi:MAG: acetyl-CoA C-acyltransferase, partial [Pseudomonadales bacterium]|nr:acetyl-CoA C-acyltransferase [Pseudomonadales bacterium]
GLMDDLDQKVNHYGGAIALGHPLGCSGSRIMTTLLNVMENKDTEIGLATMCVGLGQGVSTILQRI